MGCCWSNHTASFQAEDDWVLIYHPGGRVQSLKDSKTIKPTTISMGPGPFSKVLYAYIIPKNKEHSEERREEGAGRARRRIRGKGPSRGL